MPINVIKRCDENNDIPEVRKRKNQNRLMTTAIINIVRKLKKMK